MASSLANRIFHAHLELSYRLGRRVSLAEFGAMIADELGRPDAFTAAAVSRWEKGQQIPSPRIIEAIAAVAQLDPGWISHGEKTSAPGPARIGVAQQPVVSRPAPTRRPAMEPPTGRGSKGSRRD